MIIDFSIKNFGPIKDEVTLSFEASNDKKLNDYYVVEPIKGVRLLKMILIYGSNASGKTTVLKALDLLRDLVIKPFDKKTQGLDYDTFLFDKETKNGNSSFKINFIAKGTKYFYEIVFNKKAIIEENLYSYPNKAIVYKRTSNLEKQVAQIKTGSKIKLREHDITALENVTLWNNTVLGGFLKVNIDFPILKDVINWFKVTLKQMINPHTDLYGYVSSKMEKGDVKKNDILTLLKKADLMIEDIIPKQEDIPLDDKTIEKLEKINSIPEQDLQKIKSSRKIEMRKVTFLHRTDKVSDFLDYNQESLGTQRFYQLSGVLDMLLRKGCVFPIDELENSLHPDLFEYFLRVYLANSKTSQLVATTHFRELLMNRDMLRNDAIWFTEKKKDGSTDLFSLADFDSSVIRDTSSVYNAYKIGKLGAVPNLGDYYINLENDEKDK